MFVPGLCLCPVYLSLFICKTCPLVLQLQLTLPAGCIYSSFQLDSDIYVHLLRTIVRHLEGLAPFSPLTLFLFSLPLFFPSFFRDRKYECRFACRGARVLNERLYFGKEETGKHLSDVTPPCSIYPLSTLSNSWGIFGARGSGKLYRLMNLLMLLTGDKDASRSVKQPLYDPKRPLLLMQNIQMDK